MDFQRALGILRSDCNPWRPFPKTLVYRAALPPAPHPELPTNASPKRGAPTLSGSRFQPLPSVRRRHFLRDETLDPHGSGLGCGPCLAGGQTHCQGMDSQATLCTFSTTLTLVVGAFTTIPRCWSFSRRSSRLRWGLHSSPLYRSHRYVASSLRPGCGRLPVGRDRALFCDCEVARRLSIPLFGLPVPNF